ncbi:Inhibin beta B chain [Halotydeus destructor]|nr:Inhibin beta B chain [Halotydeus destructor]
MMLVVFAVNLLTMTTLDSSNRVQCACQHLQRVRRSPSEPEPETETPEAFDEQLLRLEFIKQQILHKLGMERAPRARRKPTEVESYIHLMGEAQQSRYERSQGPRVASPATLRAPGSSYATEDLDKLFIMPTMTTSTSATFNLTMNPTTSGLQVKKVTLLLKQRIDIGMASDFQITMSTATWHALQAGQAPFFVGLVEPDSLPDSFENYLHEPIVQWIEYDLTQLLSDQQMDKQENMVVISSRWLKFSKAYLRIEFEEATKHYRSRRSADCDAIGNSTSCCRESFYVNFTQIGWDNWILQPQGYFANYCKGKCDLSHARYHHTTVVQKYPSIISLCCSPREMSHISLIYIDEDGYVLQKNLPNMVVESCDCA